MKTAECRPLDEIYTQTDDDGSQITWNVSAIKKWLALTTRKPSLTHIEPAFISYCFEKRGVEQERCLRLLQSPEACKIPIIYVLRDGKHYLVDGVHRLVIYFNFNVHVIPAYIITWEDSQPFIVEDLPQMAEEDVMAYSFLNELRSIFGDN